MSDKTLKMIRIKWVRSGIGFTYRQKTIVRSLGLTKLNHTVLRPDTPQIRGIVASVPHLLEIVAEPVAPAWASIPEYTVHAAAAAPAEVAAPEVVVAEPVAAETVAAEADATEAKPARVRKKKKSAPEAAEPAEAGKE